jgi:sulfofructose kinase
MPARNQAGLLCVGIATLDHVFGVESFPVTAEKHRAKDLTVVGGGLAANAAVAAARLGGRVMMAARLGEDAAGAAIVAEFEAEGVDCSLVRRWPGRRSPISAVMVDNAGERLVLSYQDPEMPVAPEWMPEDLPAGIDCVLGDTRWPEGARHLFGLARTAGRIAVLDGDRKADAALMAAATHVAFSEQGLAEMTGIADPAAALAAVATTAGGWVAVTLGGRGVLHWDGRRPALTPAFRVEAVDTLGAGDVWHGAFALALAEGKGESAAIVFANAAAALKCTRFGGRAGAPKRAEVEAFMKGQAA